MSDVNPSLKKRLLWIDYSKGLAILIIILYHFCQEYRVGISWIDLISKRASFLAFAAVDIFFVIAGFNVTLSLLRTNLNEINWLSWLRKRLIRLYPTYWLAISLTLVLYWLANHPNEVQSVDDFGLILIGWPGYARYRTFNTGLWFFSVIVQAYLLIPVLFLLLKAKPKLILMLGLGLGILTKIIAIISIQNRLVWGYGLIQTEYILSYIFPLCLGIYWAFHYYKKQSFSLQDWLVSATLFGLGLFIYGIFNISGFDTLYMLGFDIFLTPFLMLIYYWFSENIIDRITWINKGISLVGINSYQIYLIHQPLFFVLIGRLIRTLGLGTYPKLAVSFALTAFLLIGYVLLLKFLEHILAKVTGKFISKKSIDKSI